MTRTKIADRVLPDYTKGEEIFNSVSHGVGVPLGIAVLVLCCVRAALHGNHWGILSGVIFGVGMLMLYAMSCIYHGLPAGTAKKVFQVFDHCTIYLLIAGTYAPILLTGIRLYSLPLCVTYACLVWTFCVIGVTFTAIDLRKYRVFSMICYMGMGWSVIFATKDILKAFPPSFFHYLLAGGIVYTVGAILYGIGSKKRYFHSVFHVFVLVGSVLQFIGIYLYCM